MRKMLAADEKGICVMCFKGTRVQWVKRVLKLCFYLCYLRWLKPTRRRVSNFKPETSLIPKVLLAVGQMKSKSTLPNELDILRY